ncbi:MAG: PAS domain-containing protein [Labilithrix sp.]|nr:PAS domain-containing protein [Labilithrix sp.]
MHGGRREATDERYELLLNAVCDRPVIALSVDGSILFWSSSAARFLGWREEEVFHERASSLCAEEEHSGHLHELVRRAEIEGRVDAEAWLSHRDGTRILASIALFGFHGGAVLVVRAPPTPSEAERERAALAAEVQRQRDVLQSLIEQIPVGVVFHDARDRNIRLTSRWLAELWGRPWERATTIDELVSKYPAFGPDGHRFATSDYAAVRALGGERFRQEMSITLSDGTTRTLIDRGEPVFDGSGHLLGSVAVVEDITAERVMLRERERLLDETLRAVRAREDVLAVVSHDLRGPLSVIAMAAARLDEHADELDAAAVRALARRMRLAAASSEKIIGDLLDFARIEVGRLFVERAEHSVGDIVHEVLDSFEDVAARRDIALRSEVGEVGKLCVFCDRARIVQALGNLVGNALKFTPPGAGIDIEARRRGGELAVSVRDGGPGLDETVLEHVFDRYWQAESENTKHGLGLGLAIVKGIVEAHGGRVWAESPRGGGATFTFTVPLEEQTAAAPPHGDTCGP